MRAHKVLADAGLSGDGTVKPLSIRNSAGYRMYKEHGIEATAELMGHDDLNRVRKEIGIREHAPRRPRRKPDH